jgi:hypothetical protein
MVRLLESCDLESSDDDIDGKQDGEVEENDQVGRQNEDIVQGEDGG